MFKLIPKPNFSLIGHRGVAGLRPENTCSSFNYAAILGLNWVEFDVQLTRDNQWVVMHDLTVERTTNGLGNLADYTLSELANLEAGLWFKPPFSGEHIPTLQTVLTLCAKLGLQTNIELKGSEYEPDKYTQALASFLTTNFPANANKPLLSSFDLTSTLLLRQLLPNFPVAHLIEKFAADTLEIVQKHKLDCINCDVEYITSANLESAQHLQIPVLLYTINDIQTAQHWLAQGVSAIFTDRPDLLQKA